MQAVLRLSRAIDRLVIGVGKIGAWAIIPLIVIIIFDVITRKIVVVQQAIMNSPLHAYVSSTKLQEWEWHLHTVIFFCALGYAYVTNAHVRVDLVREKLPVRGQAAIEFIGLIVFMLPYVTLVLYFGIDFVRQSYVSGEVSSAMTGLSHRWIIKSFVLLAMVLTLLGGLSMLARLALYLFGPRERHPEIQLPMLIDLAAAPSSQRH